MSQNWTSKARAAAAGRGRAQWDAKTDEERRAVVAHLEGCRESFGEAARRAASRAGVAVVNAMRRRCGVCGLVSTPGALGRHQAVRDHTGWTDVPADQGEPK